MARFADDSPNESEVDVKPLLYACKVTNKIRNSNSFSNAFFKIIQRAFEKTFGQQNTKNR